MRYLETVAHAAPIGMVLLDEEENVLLWNAAAERMFGWTADEVLGKPYPLVPEERREESKRLHAESLKGTASPPIETLRQRKDGSAIYISTACTPLADENGKISQVLLFIQDVTAQKLASVERERLITDLQDALARVKTLTGLLPICASCKKIRDDGGQWNNIESYIRERSEADFTHSICPDCTNRLYPGVVKK